MNSRYNFAWLSNRPAVVIAEIGINHDGSLDTARNLVAAAKNAGAVAVKFQYRNINRAYLSLDEIGDEIIANEIERTFIAPNSIEELAEFAKKLGLRVGISFFDAEDCGDFSKLDLFDFYKIPSVELCNLDLIDRVSLLGKPVVLSLGCHTEAEIRAIMTELDRRSDTVFGLMHCVSNYPVHPSNALLGYIAYFQEHYGIQLGYSSHDVEWIPCLVAATLGAPVIERHITLDKRSLGLDHSSSSTPEEMRQLVHFLDQLPNYLSGNGPRQLNQGEVINRQNLGRSFYARKNIESCSVTCWSDFEYRAPQVGMGWPDRIRLDKASKLPVAISKNSVLPKDVFSDSHGVVYALNQEQQSRLQNFHISIPVRLHDYNILNRAFGLLDYEFHLSHREVGKLQNGVGHLKLSAHHNYSIHLPDYISSTQLIDPLSKDSTIKKESCRLIETTVEWAQMLQNKTGKSVPVVGSFSISGVPNSYHRYECIRELQLSYASKDICFLPQWLPPYAWYFGGSVPLFMFNDSVAVQILSELGMEICFDLCHFQMGRHDGRFGSDSGPLLESLLALTRHVHLATAEGVFDEGKGFDDLSVSSQLELNLVMEKCKGLPFVLEVWQGHLFQYRGFYEALLQIERLLKHEQS